MVWAFLISLLLASAVLVEEGVILEPELDALVPDAYSHDGFFSVAEVVDGKGLVIGITVEGDKLEHDAMWDWFHDCDVTEWVPAECSVSCGDACPDPTDPYACGGRQALSRSVVIQPNSFGYRCAALARKGRSVN